MAADLKLVSCTLNVHTMSKNHHHPVQPAPDGHPELALLLLQGCMQNLGGKEGQQRFNPRRELLAAFPRSFLLAFCSNSPAVR